MHPRLQAIQDIGAKNTFAPQDRRRAKIDYFGHLTFHPGIMQKKLSKTTFDHLKQCMEGSIKLNPKLVSEIAEAMKEWAVDAGATYFCHWFQPMTGHTAEKQDAFMEWTETGTIIEKFSAKHLLRGEPDASSFPSGGLRSTSAARGYTSWDPTSLPFLWEAGGNKVLCIPSIFFSWTGKALDMKIPLLRSEGKISQAMLRLVHLLGLPAEHVYGTLGCEQEYFLIDRSFYLQRPDLIMTGRTLCGAPSPKGQELEDHYFGATQERVMAFLTDLEREAFLLGIPLKTRHSEVAPHQFELAPIFEKSSLAIDHNILLMELMRQIAKRHHLACLLHEKPFARINGSGKHCNWSVGTNRGLNFLDPGSPTHNHLPFLITLTATLHAVYKHGALLRGAIGSAGNDHRLGGHEAPPAIISVYLGQELEKWLTHFEENRSHIPKGDNALDLGLPAIGALSLDETDRNRTSPFAFTGNKFEFRAVGSSQNCAFPVTVLNTIVAESVHLIIDEIEKKVLKDQPITQIAPEVLRKFLKISKPIRFAGDNYSAAWHKEAKKRKLPIIEKSLYAFKSFLTPESIHVFQGVLSKEELHARIEIFIERYTKIMNIEAATLADMFYTQIFPVCMEYQKNIAKSLKSLRAAHCSVGSRQKKFLEQLSRQIEDALAATGKLEKEREKAGEKPMDKRAALFCDTIGPQTAQVRVHIDTLEACVDDRLWPFPKYREMLNIL